MTYPEQSRAIENLAQHANEKEVLLPRDAEFEVADIQTESAEGALPRVIVKLKEV